MKRRIAMLTAALMCLSAMPMTGVNAVSDVTVSAAVEKIDSIEESELTETVKGDVNADGLFNIADAVLFRKWLVKAPGAKLADWKAADLHEDGKLDVFDFCAMKKKLIQSGTASKQKITMEEIIELSKKGYDLTWSDFEKYQYEDVGSGLYIYELEVENEDHENIFLLVGGGSLDELPAYIRLRRCDNENNEIDTIDIRSQKFQVEAVLKPKITAEDIIELSKKDYELTWSDFEKYQYEDIGSGLYVYKLKIETDKDRFDGEMFFEDKFLLIGGSSLDELPEYIWLCLDDSLNEDLKTIDIRSQEFQELLDWLNSDEPWFDVPEDDETNRSNALKLGKYALAELQKGNYNIDTVISSEHTQEMMNEEMAELFNESVFYYLRFVDEHTVSLTMGSKGLLDAQGYLITDGSVEYEIGTMVPVPYGSYDGGGVSIHDADGDLYYFYATT